MSATRWSVPIDRVRQLAAWPRELASRPRVRRGLQVAALAAVAAVWHPFTQCVVLRFMDPWFTWTELEVCRDHWRETGELAWPVRDDVALADLPDVLPIAAVTSEDQRFFEHHGFDEVAIRRAWYAYEHPQPGEPLRGGSTISQQVARNVFLWQERTWIRKGLEAWYTVFLELVVPKQRILELYLTVAETAPMTFGVGAASEHWYHKPASALGFDEAAAIIACLPSPRHRAPWQPYVQKKVRWIERHAVAIPPGIGQPTK